jgi:hypothetical protein
VALPDLLRPAALVAAAEPGRNSQKTKW